MSAGATLLKLQQIDLELARNKSELANMPELKELASKRKTYVKLKSEMTKLYAQRKDLDIELDDLNTTEIQTNNAIEAAKKRHVDGSDYREVQDLENELATLAKRLDKIEHTRKDVVIAHKEALDREARAQAIIAKFEEGVKADTKAALRERGVHVVGPGSGYLACGDVDTGRMSEPEDIVEAVCEVLNPAPQDLAGKSIIITAGPTHEPIDPVRFIGNRSSGKMGIALAGEAARRGAEVTLVLGPTSLDVPRGVECVRVQTAAEMLQAALSAFQTADTAICAAAVADYTPAAPADHKLKKANERLDRIELVETVDILAELSRQKGERRVIGFAAETDNVVEYAERKLARKGCDAIVANDVSRADSGFGTDTNKAWIVSTTGTQELPVLTKPQLADTILDLLKNN